MKKLIYYLFTKIFIKYQLHPLFRLSACILQKIFGYAVFDYGGIKLAAGPVGYLDRYIILGKNINPLVTSALKQYCKNGGVFLDIGANLGVLSLLASRNKKLKIFSFDPSSRELSRFWKNLALNQANNISVLAYGLGEHDTQQKLTLSTLENTGMNSLPEIYDQGPIINCHFSSLDKLLSVSLLKQTCVCKLDVEGQEMFILNSLRAHMNLFKQCIFIVEISPKFLTRVGFKWDDIYQFFELAGFKYQFGNPESLTQWDEVFYHPEYSSQMIYTEELS